MIETLYTIIIYGSAAFPLYYVIKFVLWSLRNLDPMRFQLHDFEISKKADREESAFSQRG